MDNSIYISLSKQMVQFRKMDIIANNMANTETPSFKQNVMLTTDWTINNGNRQKISFAQDLAQFRNTEDGSLQQTSNPLDIAISGDAYMSVETANGTQYTKSGNLKLDANGTLILPNGLPVLGQGGGRITIPPEANTIEFAENGGMFVDEEEFGQLDIVTFPNSQKLERLADGLYRSAEAGQPADPTTFRVSQGFIEGSNVQPIIEMAEMIKTNRSVGSTSEYIKNAYELQKRAMQAWSGDGSR